MEAKYQIIKSHIAAQIDSGQWLPGDKILSENELADKFSVSRMTARKAIDKLCEEGGLVRSQGLGTFVADIRPMSSLLEIRNIADEIVGRGHEYACDVINLSRQQGDKYTMMLLAMQPAQTVFHSTLVHFENGVAVQYEDRYLNPLFAPDYLNQDFIHMTPNAYLTKVAPLTEADHIVEAVRASSVINEALHMDANMPCLKVTRRTWSKQGVVSIAYLFHPGDRYRLGGHLNF